MKKILIALPLFGLGLSINHVHADVGLTSEIAYTNHSFTLTGNDATFPISGAADITITVQNANTQVPANAVWVYLKFPCRQFLRPQRVVSTPANFVLLDSSVSGNEVILKFGNNAALPAPASAPDLYRFVVRGVAVASSESYSSDGTFQGNFANMEYADGIVVPGTAITQSSLQGITKRASVVGEPLPVDFTDFSVRKQQNTALLQWNTSTELNNKGFDIERSADGKNFAAIGYHKSLAVNGNSFTPIRYTYVDSRPTTGNNYYRLKQIDQDGSATYSDVEKITFDAAYSVNLYPNPAHHKVIIDCATAEKITVYNLMGQEIYVPIQQNKGVYEMNTSQLPSGSYTVSILNGTVQSSYKVVIQHP